VRACEPEARRDQSGRVPNPARIDRLRDGGHAQAGEQRGDRHRQQEIDDGGTER